jgi:bifunctional ADP-heptose synthase (sugar kinase/adenylyltransferase)
VKGSEYIDNIPEREIVEKNGGKIVFIKRNKNDISTTKIIDKILNLYG